MTPKTREEQMSDYQMVKHAEHLLIDVKKIYPDVKLSIEKGIPVVEMPEWRFEWYYAIRVLENLKDDLLIYD